MYHNVLAQTSQINFLQQQQQQQQQQSNNLQQPMQSQQYYCYPTNQQGTFPQNQYVQPYQQDPYIVGQQQQQQYQQQPIQRAGLGNLGQQLNQTSYNVPSMMQPQTIGYGSLPPHILDQIRSYIGTPGPIFILPSNNCPNPTNQQSSAPANPPANIGCPGIGINCPSTSINGCQAGSCYPCLSTMPMFNNFPISTQNNTRERKNCGCNARKNSTNDNHNVMSNSNVYRWTNETDEQQQQQHHRCTETSDDTICGRKNCPSAINLQALASQLLAIQGVISCAATRLVLRKIPGSNVTTSAEETIELARETLKKLSKEQLLSETRCAQQVNALLNLHMTANPPINVIPVLTNIQLKINLLKSHVDASLNHRLAENQGIGSAENCGNLDAVMLATKNDQELRDLLGTLRQKECDERVNLSFAPYKSQRVIAESRLTNLRNKIGQIEEEMDRRRAAILPRTSICHRVNQQTFDPGCPAWYGYTGDIENTSLVTTRNCQNYESPDPFRCIQVRNPRRLNLKPHVGSPETTYENTEKARMIGHSSLSSSSRTRRDSDEEDCEDSEKRTRRSNSGETGCCDCEKSSDDDSADEAKKKLGAKISEAREIVDRTINRNNGEMRKGGVSVVKLSPNVTILIDDTGGMTREKIYGEKNKRWKKITDNGYSQEAERENSIVDGSKSLVRSRPVERTRELEEAGKRIKVRDQKIEQNEVYLSKVKDNKEKVSANEMNDSVDKMAYDLHKMAGNVDNMADNADKMVNEINDSVNEMVDSVHKMAGNVDNMADNADKIADEMDDSVNKMADNVHKIAGNVHNMTDNVDNMADNADKMADNVNKMEVYVERMEVNANKMANNVDKMKNNADKIAPTTKPSTNDKIDYDRENLPSESLREETVRMIKIHCEPSVFRSFGEKNPTDAKKIIEERYKGSFTENSSLKSTSTESIADSNFTNESVSLRVENYEESIIDATEPVDSRKNNIESLVKKETRINIARKEANEKINKNPGIQSESKIDTRKKKNKEADEIASSPYDENDDSRNDLISGALTTIGNHVASFGSIIGKIAGLKLHRGENSSSEIILKSRCKNSLAIEDNSTAAGSSGEAARDNENLTSKDMVRWKYIRFSDVQESASTSNENFRDNHDQATYTLPVIKHSVIENRSKGEKYVIMEKSQKFMNKRLGEPYKTGRSLVIRSHPKSPQTLQQTVPFTIVRGPRRSDKNCIALSLVNVRSLGKNRFKNDNELRSSEKFWLRTQTRDEPSVKTSKVEKTLTGDYRGENKSRVPDSNSCANNDHGNTYDSIVSLTNESVVRIHDYSRFKIKSSRSNFDATS